MDYRQTLDYLYGHLPMYQRVGKAAYKADLENSYALDEYFHYPHRNYPVIHVAGTNGKGSVCHILASVFQHAGYKTGLHTSPHMFDFRERVKINGEKIGEKEVTRFVGRHKSFFEKLNPSFFEMSVFMALDCFAQSSVDIAIIEVGLGGRLDSTNVVNPELSVITNIGLDHTEFLGDTLEKIAAEKGGIIKPGRPVVIGENQSGTREVFERITGEQESPVFFAQDNYEYVYTTLDFAGYQSIRIRNMKKGDEFVVQTDLLGTYQRKNSMTCLMALDILKLSGWKVSAYAMQEGFRSVKSSTGLSGRWQVCGYNPLFVCDIAHNYDGIAQVVEQVKNTPYKDLHMVIGFVADKELDRILKILPGEAKYYFTRPDVPRGLDSEKLTKLARQYGLKGKSYNHVISALKDAQSNAEASDLIMVCGSTFLVADFLALQKT